MRLALLDQTHGRIDHSDGQDDRKINPVAENRLEYRGHQQVVDRNILEVAQHTPEQTWAFGLRESVRIVGVNLQRGFVLERPASMKSRTPSASETDTACRWLGSLSSITLPLLHTR